MRIGLARVHGRSMLPALREGDRLVVMHGQRAQPGDVVVARLPSGVIALKRVEAIDERGCWLGSDNDAEGWNSRAWGQPVPVPEVLAVARLRLWPRPALVRRFIP